MRAILAVASILPLVGRNPLRAPLATWGMVLAHFGIAVALAGMASNAAFTARRLPWPSRAKRFASGRGRYSCVDVVPGAGKNWTAIEAELRATRGEGPIELRPQMRYFSDPPTETSEAAIVTFWNGQLYTVIGKPDPGGAWQLRLWWKPFVTLIWAGGALIALGGALALSARRCAGGGGAAGRRMAAGGLRMSRAVRFAPVGIAAVGRRRARLAARDARPAPTSRRSLKVSPCRRSPCRRRCPASRRSLPPTSPKANRTLLNVFASWCVPCIEEVQVLQQLQAHGVAIDGIAVRDRPADIAAFLARNGDPYDRIGSDPQSSAQIALGSSGVPESFIVDARGIIRYQHIGPIEAKDLPDILRRLEQAE